MSWRRWQGWEPAETTRHYDPEGNLTGYSVATREAEWNEENRTYSLALLDHEARLCDGCGRDLTETTNPAHEGHYHVEDPGRCYCCTAIGSKAEVFHKPLADGRPSTHQPQALRFPVTFHKPPTGGG